MNTQVKKPNSNSITLEGNFNRYIFEAVEPDNHFFIASVYLKPYAMDNLKQHLVEEHGEIIQSGLSPKRDIPLLGTSEHFKNEVQDKMAEYSFDVSVSYDEKYKRYQLNLISFVEKTPTTPEAMINFLSRKIKSIGKVTAKKIVQHFGIEHVEYVLNNEIERLKEIKSIKESQIETIKNSWLENKMVFEVMNYLKDFDVSDSVGLKIYQKHGRKSLEIIKTNPYNLCLIKGIGFKLADKIALAHGVNKEDSKRITFGIHYIMDTLMNKSGDTILDINKVIREAAELLDIKESLVHGYILALIKKEKIVAYDEKWSVYKNFDNINQQPIYGITTRKIIGLEEKVFNLILDLVSSNHSRVMFSKEKLEEYKNTNPKELDEYQLQSVLDICQNKIVVLTGGPGTGKSRTCDAINAIYEEQNYNVVLLAPTGKAAQRLSQSTKKSAETIHRYLKILPEEMDGEIISTNTSLQSKDEFLDCDLIVIDESSMLDLTITYQLLKRVNPHRTSLLFVGDIDQLPPVGLGYVLRDIIHSKLVKVCRLEKLHRQAEDSNIAINAQRIKQKKALKLNKTNDFEYINANNEQKIVDTIREICQSLVEQNISPLDIQILSPTREISLGCKRFNQEIRPIINPNFISELHFNENNKQQRKFFVGDKVIQVENNYELMVFNGDSGIIKDVGITGKNMIVEFGDPKYKLEQVEYEKSNFNELELAYCITIHKSQGSDYPYVIIPLTRKHYYQWTQQLLYTAITRAKTKVFLVGSMDVLLSVNHERKNEQRTTNLEKLFETWNQYNNAEEFTQEISPF